MTLSYLGIYMWVLLGGMLLLLIPWYNFIDSSAIFVSLFGISYGLFAVLLNILYSGSSLISYFIVPLPVYCLGRWIVYRLKGRNNEYITFVFLSLLCISIILLYRTVIDVAQNGIVSINRTFGIEGIETISATLYGMYAAITMVGLPVFLHQSRKGICSRGYS